MARKDRDYKVCCETCKTNFISSSYQTKFCSKDCRRVALNTRRRERSYMKDCECCGIPFLADTKGRRFCTPQCKGKNKYVTGKVTTLSQYEKISGNWIRYLSRLLYAAGRKRDELTREILLEILEKQNYKCAISGLDLTCQLEKGKKIWSNASVDRVNAGGPYTKDNIQLVCRAVNSWRSDMPLEAFIEVCRAVANNNPEEGKVRYAHVTKTSRL